MERAGYWMNHSGTVKFIVPNFHAARHNLYFKCANLSLFN